MEVLSREEVEAELLLLLEELLEELLLPEELPPFSLLLTAESVFSPATPSAESPFAFWKL